MIYNQLNQIIQFYDDIKTKRIAICPFGQNGMETKQILNWAYGVSEELIIDNYLYIT